MFDLYLSDGELTTRLTSGDRRWPLHIQLRAPEPGAETVTESTTVFFAGRDEARQAVRELNQLFAQARHYQARRMGGRVYATLRLAQYEEPWRSEILDGRVEWHEDALDTQFAADYMEASVIWTRRGWWEGEEVELALAGRDAAPATGGVAIRNHNDGDAASFNFVDVLGHTVGGDLPAPVRLEMLNTGLEATRRVYIAHNAYSAPNAFPHILEAEHAFGVTPISSTAASNDSYATLTWSGTSEAVVAGWDLSQALLNAAAGNYFRVLVRLASTTAYTDLQMRARLQFGGAELQSGPVQLLPSGGQLYDLGVVRLPPNLPLATDLYPLVLSLLAKRSAAGSHSLDLDFVQLSPLDGWRALQPAGGLGGLFLDETLVDDGIEGHIYRRVPTGSGGKVGTYIGYGQPIALQPGRDQRLYILCDLVDGTAPINRSHIVRAYMRPRRVTL